MNRAWSTPAPRHPAADPAVESWTDSCIACPLDAAGVCGLPVTDLTSALAFMRRSGFLPRAQLTLVVADIAVLIFIVCMVLPDQFAGIAKNDTTYEGIKVSRKMGAKFNWLTYTFCMRTPYSRGFASNLKRFLLADRDVPHDAASSAPPEEV